MAAGTAPRDRGDERTSVSNASDSASGEPHRVDAGVGAAGPSFANHSLELVPGTDESLRSEPARLVCVAASHGRDDAGAACSGELSHEPSDHPGCARHQYHVAFAYPGGVYEQPGRQRRRRAAR